MYPDNRDIGSYDLKVKNEIFSLFFNIDANTYWYTMEI